MSTEDYNMDLFVKVKETCLRIIQDPNNCQNNVIEMQNLLLKTSPFLLQKLQPFVVSSFALILKNIIENKFSYNEDQKKIFVDTLKVLFDKTKVEKIGLFFNINTFLVFEIYNYKDHKVKEIHEEYKLSIIQCISSLMKSLTWDCIQLLYTKEHISHLSPLLYTVLQVAKVEQLRSLRISAMECLMIIARVDDDSDMHDNELRSQIGDVFMFFLPGIVSGLQEIALEDEKSGHKIIMTAVKAWGRIVALVMQNFNPPDKKIDLFCIKDCNITKQIKVQWKNETEVKAYVNSTERNEEWYKETDLKLSKILSKLTKLLHHTHPKVRMELANICVLLTEYCIFTMPCSLCNVIEMLIALSNDETEEISNITKILNNLSSKIAFESYKTLLENLEENFYNTISSLPRTFNGLDECEQLTNLNLLIGYLNLFGKNNLEHVLRSPVLLKRLIFSLIHAVELEKTDVSLLEEYGIKDLELSPDLRTPWKNFKHFQRNDVKNKLENLCKLFAKYDVLDMVTDFLLDTYVNDFNNKKEATLILNEILTGYENVDDNMHLIKHVIHIYLEPENWNLPLNVMIDEYGDEHNLLEVQNNIIQICLQTEGIGKFALVLKERFQQFLLKSLYHVLERAGCGHPLVRAAGLTAVTNISVGCGYSNVTELIKENTDYFSYHVIRKLNKSENKESVLNVLAIVMKYSTMDVLPSISDIVDGVLMQSCDQYKQNNIDAYLRVFNIFIKCLRKWLNITKKIEPLKIKAEKEKEIENFHITGINYDENFSDEIMGKSAEEMWKEDMEKLQKQTEETLEEEEPEVEEEYKKPEPPMHVKLMVSILSRSLNFLPSKIKIRKLLVLEILREGIEIIRDWEDDLLPIVHQIWSPLVDRFKEFNEPVIINYSFQLLITLANLSKDFIRSRTVKDVLPHIITVLTNSVNESYLKDRGSAYRYTQLYKLQILILENIYTLVINLDMLDEHVEMILNAIFPYLSNKQPIPLQDSCRKSLAIMIKYDPNLLKLNIISNERNKINSEYWKNLNKILQEL